MLDRGKLPKQDLLDVINSSIMPLSDLRAANILVSGGSGFIGKWLVSVLLEANEKLDLGLDVVVLTRDSRVAASKLNLYESDPILFVQNDFSKTNTLQFPRSKFFTHIVHGAVLSTKNRESANSRDMIDSSNNGANALLEIASFQGNKPVFMHLSSGAVYGPQPLSLPRIPRGWIGMAGNDGISDYALVKRNTENLVTEADENGIIQGANPRLFSFFGPHLPTNEQFAIGNFMQDIVLNRDITVNGNPVTARSYMYPTDLISALLLVLTKPTLAPTQIGSSRITTMEELANQISHQFGRQEVNYLNPNAPESRYVPEIDSAEVIYNFEQKVSLEEGLYRWHKWLSR